MKKPVITTIDGKQITVFISEAKNAPFVYSNTYMENGASVIKACEKLNCKPFHLVSISKLRWDEEMSPWMHTPVVTKNDHFTGEADRYMRCLTEQIIPYAEQMIQETVKFRVIAGYSMSGLFALYAPYITDCFSALVSASGSVWYPEFVSFAQKNCFLRKPDTIYLSLGDLESRTRNTYLSQTENCMKNLLSLYQRQEIPSVFELNHGNHYKDADIRLAKGIAWTLQHQGE